MQLQAGVVILFLVRSHAVHAVADTAQVLHFISQGRQRGAPVL